MSKVADYDPKWFKPNGTHPSRWKHSTLMVEKWGSRGKWGIPENKKYAMLCQQLANGEIPVTLEIIENAGPWREAVIKAVIMGKVNRMGKEAEACDPPTTSRADVSP